MFTFLASFQLLYGDVCAHQQPVLQLLLTAAQLLDKHKSHFSLEQLQQMEQLTSDVRDRLDTVHRECEVRLRHLQVLEDESQKVSQEVDTFSKWLDATEGQLETSVVTSPQEPLQEARERHKVGLNGSLHGATLE